MDNAFIDISDFEQAQYIADSFNVRRLHRILDRYASMCCPVVKQFRAGVEWTIIQIEYARVIVFRNRESLHRLYEPLGSSRDAAVLGYKDISGAEDEVLWSRIVDYPRTGRPRSATSND